METLIQLVAASFARHGIECPDSAQHPARISPNSPAPSVAVSTDLAALPEHGFRKKSEDDLAP
ncbi:MAG: hypothetical protein WBQ72_19760 [Terriglobales bacterium]|jgi:hypothetical protein